MRNLVVIFGDQLDAESAVFDDFDNERDRVWMAEVEEETAHVHQHKVTFFLAAMRHFAAQQRDAGRAIAYHQLHASAEKDRGSSFREVLSQDIKRLGPERLVLVEPGDHRVREQVFAAAEHRGIDIELRPDRHFYCSSEAFEDWSRGKKELVLEYFYRKLRKDFSILVDEDGRPEGGEWNFDKANRESFGNDGPPSDLRPLPSFEPDTITKQVISMVENRFPENPGDARTFSLPVTRAAALEHLDGFIKKALPNFGRFQDAMTEGDAVLFHSRLSALLNTKLLSPRDCVDRAVRAYEQQKAPLNSVEGFVRQILGWREFIRGIYNSHMPGYARKNALRAKAELPSFFWDGQTDMKCVHDSMQAVLRIGYAHHIHRLMVLGLFSQLWGVHPYRFHEWHMKMYVDAVDWVSLPNTLGMSQYGDGGIVGTKPYVATGKYIQKMGPFCSTCPYDPKKAVGEEACPFTTLYWDFLVRHRDQLQSNQRMALQLKNIDRKKPEELDAIRSRVRSLKARVGKGTRI
ncbi:MAG: cryptochrome/photolyase family protein [Myxococcota bacterium]